MKMETLMSGIKGEKDHIVYKEEHGSHMGLAYDYDFMIIWFVQTYFSFSGYLAEIECCLAQGVLGRESHVENAAR